VAGSGLDFERHLAAGKLLPVYALVGAERLLVSEALQALRAKVLTKAADFNRDELVPGEDAIEKLVTAAGTLPMMAPRRWVHLAEVQAVKATDFDPLLAYLADPSPQTVLVLSGEKVDQRTKLGLALAKSGGLFVFEAPRQQDLPAFIEQRARRRDVVIDPDAAQLLADLVGADVGSIERSLEKVSLHAGAGQVVTSDDVEAMVAPTRVHSIFELTDAIGSRDLGKATLLLRNAIGGGASALAVLSMITRQFRLILQVKTMRERGASSRDIASMVRIPPFLADSLVAQARRYEINELVGALEAALRADVRLKSSGVAPEIVLDRLMVEVMEKPR
jgi:DNA polymerase-3 subunit delta